MSLQPEESLQLKQFHFGASFLFIFAGSKEIWPGCLGHSHAQARESEAQVGSGDSAAYESQRAVSKTQAS